MINVSGAVSALLLLNQSAFATWGSAPVDERAVAIELDKGEGFKPYCSGLLLQPRGASSNRLALTASHCIFNLPKENAVGLRAKLPDGQIVALDIQKIRLSVTRGSLRGRSQAVALDFGFFDLGAGSTPSSIGYPDDFAPRDLIQKDLKVWIRSWQGLHQCSIKYRCGSQFVVETCDPSIEKTYSGSPAWIKTGERWRVAGLVTKTGEYNTTITSYAAILAKNSFLSANISSKDPDTARTDFLTKFLSQPRYRLPNDEGADFCNSSRPSLIDVRTSDINDPAIFIGVAFFGNSNSLLSWDFAAKQLCQLGEDNAMRCSTLPLTGQTDKLLRGITVLSADRVLLRFDKGGALLLKPGEHAGEWHEIMSINATTDSEAVAGERNDAIMASVEGALIASEGEILLFGESGLCVIIDGNCRFARRPLGKDQGEARFGIRAALELAPGQLLAVGRDSMRSGVRKAQCALYTRRGGIWELTKFCGLTEPEMIELGAVNAALPYNGGALLFSSSGAALTFFRGKGMKRAYLQGMLVNALQPNEFDDAIRAARWSKPDSLVAVAGSDGGFHLLNVRQDSDGATILSASTCQSKRELGLWLMAMDATDGRAAAVSQAGELHWLSWKPDRLGTDPQTDC